MTNNIRAVQSRMHSRQTLKRNARLMLSLPGVRLKLIYASLISAFAAMSVFLVYIGFDLVLSLILNEARYQTASTVLLVFTAVVAFLFLSPLFFGYRALSASVSAGTETDFRKLFDYYTSPYRYFRCLAVSAVMLAPIILTVIAAIVIFSVYGTVSVLTSVLATPAVLLLLMLIYSKLFTLPNTFVCGGDQSLKSCFLSAMQSTRGKVWQIFAYKLSFTGWVALSLVTVGVLFFVFTLPYMAVARGHYSAYLITGEYRIYYLEDSYYDE